MRRSERITMLIGATAISLCATSVWVWISKRNVTPTLLEIDLPQVADKKFASGDVPKHFQEPAKKPMIESLSAPLNLVMTFLTLVITFLIAIGVPQLIFNISPHIKISLIGVDYSVPDRVSDLETLPSSFTAISYDAKLLVFNDGNRASFIKGFGARVDEMTAQERGLFNQGGFGSVLPGARYRDYFALPNHSSAMENWIEKYEHSEVIPTSPFVIKPDNYKVVSLKGVLVFQNGRNTPVRDRPLILGFKIDYSSEEGRMASRPIPGAALILFPDGNGPKLHSNYIRFSSDLVVIMAQRMLLLDWWNFLKEHAF